MKRRISALIILCAMFLAACQLDDEMYSVYDVYYKLGFTTDSTHAVLGSAAKMDSLDQRSDVWIKVKGGFEYAASNIVRYGHCWAKGKEMPVINANESNCKYLEGKPNANEPFYTTIADLECETEYSVRSFIVTSDGNIGYNPEVLVVTTDIPHDKWFETNGLVKNGIIAGRSDCVSIITVIGKGETVDTLTFFGMGRAGDACYADLWCYSSRNKTFEQIPEVKNNNGEIMRLWGAVGFGINYVERDVSHHLVYLGCGCSRGADYNRSDYNQQFFVYDIDERKWKQVTYYDGKNVELTRRPFQGEVRTGAVGFSVREWGFVGLGEFVNEVGKLPHYHCDFYLYVMEKDAKTGKYTPEKGYFNQMTDDFGFGARSGASVAMIDDYAYIIGGRGEKGYYDQLIPVRFSMPINSRPDSYTFTWPKSDNVYRFRDKFVDYDFKARGFAAGFAVGDEIFYGMGEGVDENGNTVFYSDMVKFDRNTGFLPKVCAPYMNVKSPESSVSRSLVIHGGDRAFVVGGTMQGDGDFTILNNSEWVYRP